MARADVHRAVLGALLYGFGPGMWVAFVNGIKVLYNIGCSTLLMAATNCNKACRGVHKGSVTRIVKKVANIAVA